MEKVIRNGKVAILYSPGYGAGWYSWHDKEELIFDPIIVEMVENNQHELIDDYINSKYNLKDNYSDRVYCGGSSQLKIEWLPIGTLFKITEHDGYETVESHFNNGWVVA